MSGRPLARALGLAACTLLVSACRSRPRGATSEPATLTDPIAVPPGQVPPLYVPTPPNSASAVDLTAEANTNAVALRAQGGRTFRVVCPPGLAAGTVWGTELYTDDSSICSAAVHSGRISFAAGGLVAIQMAGGLASYTASTQFGVASRAYGAFGGSYRFVGSAWPAPAAVATPIGAVRVDWHANATVYRGRFGHVQQLFCPPGGTLGTVWGTDTYTDDSSVCSAAVHSGRITLAAGGVVLLRTWPGLPSYTGTVRNGVTSQSYAAYPGSFGFVGGPVPAVPAVPVAPAGTTLMSWSDNALAYRGRNGVNLRLFCPPGGTLGTVWGTDVYTDDSSVCSAGVHAGRITLALGGTLTVRILAGRASYRGCARNGVTSVDYGSWPGSMELR